MLSGALVCCSSQSFINCLGNEEKDTMTELDEEYEIISHTGRKMKDNSLKTQGGGSGNGDIKVLDAEGNLKETLNVHTEIQKSMEREINLINPFKRKKKGGCGG